MKKVTSIILVLTIILCFTACGGQEKKEETKPNRTVEKPLHGIKFDVKDVPGDVTGNWRVAIIKTWQFSGENDGLEYYKTYFKSDDEIHFVINQASWRTIQYIVMPGVLDMTEKKYVDGEEKDADLLGSGEVVREYHIDMDTGKAERVQ